MSGRNPIGYQSDWEFLCSYIHFFVTGIWLFCKAPRLFSKIADNPLKSLSNWSHILLTIPKKVLLLAQKKPWNIPHRHPLARSRLRYLHADLVRLRAVLRATRRWLSDCHCHGGPSAIPTIPVPSVASEVEVRSSAMSLTCLVYIKIITDWWFGTWLLFFHVLGIIIPID